MESSFLNINQILSLCSGSTDSKTIDYRRTNPGEYQTVRTHTKETTWIQDLASPNPHLNNKQNKNTNPIISRQDYPLTQPCPSKEKQPHKKTQHKSHHIGSLHKPRDQPRRAETKRKKEFNLEAWGKETSNIIHLEESNENAEKYYTNEGTNQKHRSPNK